MLDECEKNGKSPACPVKTCAIPYRCESVLALDAQFPEKKAFFSKFTLQAKFSMQTLKDDIVTVGVLELDEKFCAKHTVHGLGTMNFVEWLFR